MDIYGTFSKFINRNEGTGKSRFVVLVNSEQQTCDGIVPYYHPETPLRLSGFYGEHGEFIVNNSHCDGFSEEAMVRFLNTSLFVGVGASMAKGIVNAYGNNVFEKLTSDTDIESFASKFSRSHAAIQCVDRLVLLRAWEELYDFLSGRGCSYGSISDIFHQHGRESMDFVKKAPYSLTLNSVPYFICKQLECEFNISRTDKLRIHAVVSHAMQENRMNGNTKIEFNALYTLINNWEEEDKTEALFVAEEVAGDNYHLEYDGDKIFVYSINDYLTEKIIAENIARLTRASEKLDNSLLPIQELEEKNKITYAECQKRAFACINSTGLKVVTGGPGTGKTTFLNGVIEKYKANHPNKTVVLCAPTGSAARKMQESTGIAALTIHKMLGLMPYDKKTFFNNNQLDVDFLIVDEGSMIDIYLMLQLLTALKNGTMVLILGDADQLPSVDAGNVLKDLICSGKVEFYQFDTIFRQAEGNSIIDNSKKIINGDFRLTTDKTFQIVRYDTEEEMTAAAVDYYKKAASKKDSDVRLFTPTRKFRFKSGTIQMNRMLQKSMFKNGAEAVEYGAYRFHVGDSVVFNKNDYEIGCYNGQCGKIVSIQQHSGTSYIAVQCKDGEDTVQLNLSGKNIELIELSYATTAHKSQGGECMDAIILIPQNPKSMLKRQLLYVEVTRAKRSVLILSEKNALDRCISKFMEKERLTGLQALLKAQDF